MRKVSKVVAVVGASVMAWTASAGSASAAVGDGYCNNSNEFCFYYNSERYGWGSGIDFNANVADLAGYKFKSPGNGRGEPVKNGAAAVWNKRPSTAARVYFNSNWGGVSDYVAPNTVRDLDVTKNENASFRWI